MPFFPNIKILARARNRVDAYELIDHGVDNFYRETLYTAIHMGVDALVQLGFRKYKQKLKQEDFAYWKKYDDKYQIGLFVYDFTKYGQHNLKNKVSIQFECMPIDIDGRCDLSVSKEIELPEFEKMAKSFYEGMIEYCY